MTNGHNLIKYKSLKMCTQSIIRLNRYIDTSLDVHSTPLHNFQMWDFNFFFFINVFIGLAIYYILIPLNMILKNKYIKVIHIKILTKIGPNSKISNIINYNHFASYGMNHWSRAILGFDPDPGHVYVAP